jgi:archaellum component FlaC
MDKIEERLNKIEASIEDLKNQITELDKKLELQAQNYRLKFAFYNVLIPIFIFIIGILLGRVII